MQCFVADALDASDLRIYTSHTSRSHTEQGLKLPCSSTAFTSVRPLPLSSGTSARRF
jgi:hypothetical protein